MDDQEFFEELKTSDEKSDEWAAAAEEFIRLRKTASALNFFKDPATLAVMGGSAALLGGGTYLSSRPKKELGGKSSAEASLEDAVRGIKERGEANSGFLSKLRNRQTKFNYELAKLFREHPAKAALLAGVTGAATGGTLAKLLGAGRK